LQNFETEITRKMNKRVLITGINGFTGRYLEQRLITQGFDVYGTIMGKSNNKRHFACDIREKNQVDNVIKSVKPDYLIHLAAVSFVGESNSNLIYNINIIGTENILQSLCEQGICPQKVILSSSATIYGSQTSEVLDESICPAPVNHYSISKLAMEHLAQSYFNRLNIIITRPFNYTGVGQAKEFLIPKIVMHYKERRPHIELGNLDVAREFNTIDYIVTLYILLMQSSAVSEIVNLASNKAIKLLDVIDEMNQIAGYQIKVSVNPAFVRKNEIKRLSGSTHKLHTLLPTLPKVENNLSKLLKQMYQSE